MKIIHTLLWFLNDDERLLQKQMLMITSCLKSFEQTKDNFCIIYNQGIFTNEQLKEYLEIYNFEFVILGNGKNIGIPEARQICFKYIWKNFPEIDYISELHLDMIFPNDWYIPLIDFLEKNDDPVISPGIITSSGFLVPSDEKNSAEIVGTMDNSDYRSWINVCNRVRKNEIIRGFTHPAIHKNQVIREIGGYNTKYFKGKQGFEDDSLLVSYLYYMGTRTGWYPKSNYNSIVYHAAGFQRLDLDDFQQDVLQNLNGLIKMYGMIGIEQLMNLHNKCRKKDFENILNNYHS